MWPVQLLLQTIRSPAAAHEEDAQGNRKLVKTSSSDYIEPAIISFLFMLTENKFLGCSYCPNSSIMRQKSDLSPLHLHIIKQAEDVYESYSWLQSSPGLFLLERKKNRVECIVFTVLFGEMFQKSVYFSWLLPLSVAPPFNGTFFPPIFYPTF